MSETTYARVQERLQKLRLPHVPSQLDALLSEAAEKDVSYLDFLDGFLAEETSAPSQ